MIIVFFQAPELHKEIHKHGGLAQPQQTLAGGSAASSTAKVSFSLNQDERAMGIRRCHKNTVSSILVIVITILTRVLLQVLDENQFF